MRISGICRKAFPLPLLLLALVVFLFPLQAFGAGVVVVPDSSVIIQIVNFLFTIWVLNLLLYKPIRKILTRRKEKIDGLELSIETSTKDAQEKDEAFLAGIKEARARGVEKKNALVQEATEEEKSIIADINKKAQAELTQIKETVKKDTEVARDSLQKEVDGFADLISEKILGRAV